MVKYSYSLHYFNNITTTTTIYCWPAVSQTLFGDTSYTFSLVLKIRGVGTLIMISHMELRLRR